MRSRNSYEPRRRRGYPLTSLTANPNTLSCSRARELEVRLFRVFPACHLVEPPVEFTPNCLTSLKAPTAMPLLRGEVGVVFPPHINDRQGLAASNTRAGLRHISDRLFER
jgi:hypothetical protein